MNLKFLKLHPDAVLPSYAKPGDAGLDLTAVDYKEDISRKYSEYDTGIAVEIPTGYVGLLFPRSSVSKKDLVQANSVGVIDSGYRGPIKVRFKRVGRSGVDGGINDRFFDIFDVGEVIAQLVIIKLDEFTPEWADNLSETERGEGGFGSTTDKQ